MTPLIDLLAVNTFDRAGLNAAKVMGLALEVDEYIWPLCDLEIQERHKFVPTLIKGFTKLTFHGIVIDYNDINKFSDEEMLRAYAKSYDQSRFLGIDRVVYHANYMIGKGDSCWIKSQVSFWKEFLKDKSASFRVYLENCAYETPELLAGLCDAVGDSRVKICLDTGHACCNSKTPVTQWIKELGKRIVHVHLHNNDGEKDRHWPLGRGVLNDGDVIEHLLEYTSAEAIVLECDFYESLQWLQKNGFL